jgi:hypothetical protein
MAFCVQLGTISHLIADDYWDGRFLPVVCFSDSRNGSIRITINVAIHCMGILCRAYQYGIPVEFDEMNETFNINVSNFSFDSSIRREKTHKGSNQMISIRTGLVGLFS